MLVHYFVNHVWKYTNYPSSIAIYSQAGLLFGFAMIYLILFQYPLMTVVQEICARSGLVTGSGLASLIKKRYPMKVALPFTSSCCKYDKHRSRYWCNGIFNQTIFPQISYYFCNFFFHYYNCTFRNSDTLNMSKLDYLSFSLFDYIATAIIVGDNWNNTSCQLNSTFQTYFFIYNDDWAMFGTIISSYLFFWMVPKNLRKMLQNTK